MTFRNQEIHDDVKVLINNSRKVEDQETEKLLVDILRYINRLEAKLLGTTQTLNNLKNRYDKWELK